MKKLITIAVIALASFTGSAQNPGWSVHNSDKAGGNSFIGRIASALVLTNAVNITNLNLSTYGTNWPGTVYTNKATGTRISTTTGTNGAYSQLIVGVPLWALADGGIPFTSTNAVSSFATVNSLGYGTIAVTVRAGAGTAQVITAIFAPAWDGVNVDTSGAYDFTWGFTPTASSTRTLSTNAPLYKWVGAKSVVLKSLSSADSTTTKEAAITAFSLNGFVGP